ncbi:hypothetical protein [Micromonospora aurantiaca (nom. illeg.)]|uniref:hypothetical protein n=1 Tax=Micromonospora aurantiaca (nom. illeg.) TaxID=47850 RepID=UPI0033DB6381
MSTWQDQLRRLVVDHGATLDLTSADGTVIAHTVLARHWRLDAHDPRCLWIRPIAPGYREESGAVVYSLSRCRRRGLQFTAVEHTTQELSLSLDGGLRAHIRPAAGADVDEIERWDTFVLTRLTGQEEQALDALDADSWAGRFE